MACKALYCKPKAYCHSCYYLYIVLIFIFLMLCMDYSSQHPRTIHNSIPHVEFAMFLLLFISKFNLYYCFACRGHCPLHTKIFSRKCNFRSCSYACGKWTLLIIHLIEQFIAWNALFINTKTYTVFVHIVVKRYREHYG